MGEGTEGFDNSAVSCKMIDSSQLESAESVKTGVFRLVDCEGGIGGAMHILVADQKTGEEYFMTAYKNTPSEICNFKSGTMVKIAYKVYKMKGSEDLYTYLGVLE